MSVRVGNGAGQPGSRPCWVKLLYLLSGMRNRMGMGQMCWAIIPAGKYRDWVLAM